MNQLNSKDYVTNSEKYAVFVRNLEKSYKRSAPVLQDVSMHVEKGIVYGLLGSSGCGKSTLLSCILNLRKWDNGEVFVLGERVNKGHQINGKNIGYMPQDLAMYAHLTVEEMMKYFSKLYGMSDSLIKERIAFLEDLIDLKSFRSRRIITLSGGQKRRVSFSLTLIHSPKLLILDEPTVGLDPLLREKIWDYLFNLTLATKTTIVITTHYIEEVKHANKVGVMRNGRILVEEDPAVLMRLHNTPILEDVVRNICYSDDSPPPPQLNNAVTVTFSKFKMHSNLVPDPVNLRHFYRKGSTEDKSDEHVVFSKGIEILTQKDPIKMQPLKRNMSTSNENSFFMSFKRCWEYSRITWINFIRNPMFIFIVLFLPPFQIFTTGIVIGAEPKHTRIGVVNHEIPNWTSVCPNYTLSGATGNFSGAEECEVSTFSCVYIKHLHTSDSIKPIQFLKIEDALHAVHQGDISGYIQIPKNFSQRVLERAVFLRYAPLDTVEGTIIKLKVDMTEFITMFFAMTNLYEVFFNFVRDLENLCDLNLKSIEVPFNYRSPVYGKVDGSAQDSMLPAGIAGLLFEIAFAVTPLVFVNDLKCGISERSKTAGLRSIEWMVGLLITMTSMAFFQSIICYIALVYGLNYSILGDVWLYVILCLISALLGGTLGLLLGVIFKDELVVIITAVFILPILMVHDGMLRPEEVLPYHYRSFVYYCFPTSAVVRSFRFVMNRGLGLLHPQVWPGVLITLGWSAVYSILSFIVIKRS